MLDHPLDTTVPVMLGFATPVFSQLSETWPDRDTARYLRDLTARKDVVRAHYAARAGARLSGPMPVVS